MQDRSYQGERVDAAVDLFQGGTDSVLVHMATGCGKTHTAGLFAQRVKDIRRRTGRTLFLAHRGFLIRQTDRAMKRLGLTTTIEMAAERSERPSDVVVATVQTMKGDRLASWAYDAFDAIVTDECHRVRAKSYADIYAHFRDTWHYGTTATAGRADGKNLGTVFQDAVPSYGLKQAIGEGWLVPIRPLTIKTSVDLRNIRTTRGKNKDLNAGDLAERIGPHLESLCRDFAARVGDRAFVIYLPDVGSSYAASVVMSKLGFPTKYVAGTGGKWGMKKEESRSIMKEFGRWDIQGIACCDLLTEGWDEPHLSCVCNMRPTISEFTLTQRVGRGTRPSEETGKTDCLFVDFDWLTDDSTRDLCSVVDIFDDGSVDYAVKKKAKELIAKKSYKDVLEAIAEAEDYCRSKPRLDIQLSAFETKLSAEYVRDPSGLAKLLGIKLVKRQHFDRDGRNPATRAQAGMLRHLGVDEGESMSKWGAAKMITEMKRRKDAKLATPFQVQKLINLGVSELIAQHMGADDAFRTIDSMKGKHAAR